MRRLLILLLLLWPSTAGAETFINGVSQSTAESYSDPFLGLSIAYTNVTTITFGVDAKAPFAEAQILMFDSTGAPKWFAFTGTRAVAMTVDGINGLETVYYNAEGEEASHNYHVYALGQSDGTVGFLMVDDDDYAAGPHGGGWSSPSGYTYVSYPVMYLYNDSGSDLIAFDENNGFVFWRMTANFTPRIINNGTAGSLTDITSSARVYIPEWATTAIANISSATAGQSSYVSHDGTFYSGTGSENNTFINYSWDASLSFYYSSTGGTGAVISVPRWQR